MKKAISIFLCLIMLLSFSGCDNNKEEKNDKVKYPIIPQSIELPQSKTNYHFYASQNGYFYKSDGKPIYINGVNIGLTTATTNLDNPNVSYDTYIKWFSQISEMNANTVRVFTVMNPNFYNALYDYNYNNPDNLLYLIQGIWFPENLMYELKDALESDEILIGAFKRSVKETIDIIHGNSDYTTYGEFSPAIYEKNVSKYVIGYILGLEYPAEFVVETNASHPNEATYEGEFLYTDSDSSPFEAFLCEVGDTLVEYETKTYSHQTPIAFLNWQTLDVLEHTNEPFAEEDEVSVNTEKILSRSEYATNQFAAVDIYPYYPEFMNHQKEYLDFKDESRNSDPYRAYLRDLRKEYSMPVLVAEYGLSTSRGVAHLSANGYDQGGLTEQEQGKYVSQMSESIALEGYCGGLVFSWQDEWFKRTWNSEMFYPDNPTDRTYNLSSAEQGYGLVSHDVSTVYPDGDYSDWSDTDYIPSTKLKVQYDANYMHIYAQLPKDFDFNKDTYYIPVSILGIGSNFAKKGLSFNQNIDFIIEINGKENTRILCDEYYDLFGYKYGVIKKIFPDKVNLQKNTGNYIGINTFVSNEMYLPEDKLYIEPKFYESGLLNFGNANPDSENYNSQADFYYKDGVLEIRVAWYLLNVANARLGICMSEFTSEKVEYTDIKDISIGCGENGEISLYSASFSPLGDIKTTERLKQSYYILKETFANINGRLMP